MRWRYIMSSESGRQGVNADSQTSKVFKTYLYNQRRCKIHLLWYNMFLDIGDFTGDFAHSISLDILIAQNAAFCVYIDKKLHMTPDGVSAQWRKCRRTNQLN